MKDAALDEKSVVPLYYQVREAVRRRIEAGEWKPGEFIPPEVELQEAFGVSRATIRQALLELVAEGLIVRKRGRGSLVATPKIDEALPRLVSFTEEMRSQNLTPSTRRTTVQIVDGPKRVTEALRTPPGESFLYIERVRCAGAEPIVLLRSYLPQSLGVDPGEDFSGSLYALLEGKYGVRLGEAFQEIEGGAADEYTAEQLEMEEGDPILIIRRAAFSKTKKPVEYVEGFYRADRYRYSVRLER